MSNQPRNGLSALHLAPPRIISGGQTGVDRVALDLALERGFPCGGWCPKGRRSEDGPIAKRYPLRETASTDYAFRTRKNIEAADGTLILCFGSPSGGTALTLELTRSLSKPALCLDLEHTPLPTALQEVRQWLKFWRPAVLNIAGPRERAAKDIGRRAGEFLDQVFDLFRVPVADQPAAPAGATGSRTGKAGHPRAPGHGFRSWPEFAPDEIRAVTRVLKSGRVNYWTGTEGMQFERDFARFVGAPYAVALANGTVALEAALYALDIGPGDEVIVPCRSFVASASSVSIRGATPVFADVDPDSQTLTATTIEAVLTRRTKAVIAVHLAGWPCDMDPIMTLAHAHGLKVIEDCAQSLGAAYKGRQTGTLGDIAAFSFCQDKIMTTGGEGGMLTTASSQWWEKVWSYKDHGRSFDAVFHRDHPPGFRWLYESIGTNMRMTEIQAVLGRTVLPKVPGWISRRRKNAAYLLSRLAELEGLRLPVPAPESFHSYYKFYAFVRPECLRPDWDRDRIVDHLNREGVACMAGSCSEIYLEKAFQDAGQAPRRRLPVGKLLGETALMFQVHHSLPMSYLRHVVMVLTKILAEARR